MAPPKGNEYWRNAIMKPAKRKFETSEELAEACVSYFEWVEENPVLEEKLFVVDKKIEAGNLRKQRAPTLNGLQNHIPVTAETWIQWRKKRKDLSEVIKRVESIIYDEKYVGAAAGVYNSNIIARDLGLRDKLDIKDETPPRDTAEVDTRLLGLLERFAKGEDS